ncbi:MAG: polysaccharide deacetylase family protein [Anaerovoracaceae bacterium]|jgi:peptidoglycan/xylan/chitin deacetylase (PgdA/CDA1 family)
MARRYRLRRDRRSSRARLILLLAAVIVIAVVAAFVIYHIRTADGYHNAGSFERYVKKYSRSIDGSREVGTAKTSCRYGEPVSISTAWPKLSQSRATKTISSLVSSEEKTFRTEYGSRGADTRAALLIDYESYKTPQKAVGVAIHEKQRIADGDNASFPVDTVHTYNFATKTGTTLSDGQIFNSGYLKKASGEVKKELEDRYGDDLKTSALSASASHYSKYVLTDDGVRFYFDAGTVTDADEGVVSVDVSYDTLGSTVRDDIGERVIDPDKPMLAITYDDGPDEHCTAQLLDIYKKNSAVCTFFELGQNVENVKGADRLLQRELSQGCEIGTHSYSHPNQLALSDDAVRQQAEKSKAAIRKACGREPTIARPPYGNGSDKIAQTYDLPMINWDIDSLDWKSRNAASILSEIKKVKDPNGCVILMHSIYPSTVEATRRIVPYLQQQGYQLVTVSELLEYHYNEKPKKGKWYGYTFEELNSGSTDAAESGN